MKVKIVHIYEMIAGAVLSLLGFTSCNGIPGFIEPAGAEYGTPHATFKVVGDVKAADGGKPIPGIAVKFARDIDGYYPWGQVEGTSDKDGKVDFSFTEWPEDKDIMLTFEDVDGADNGGLFAPDTLRTKDLRIDFVEDKKSSWHKGVYTISFQAKLKKASGSKQ